MAVRTAMRGGSIPSILFASVVVFASAAGGTTKVTRRRLEDTVEEYLYDDLAQFSLHFDMCQDIRMYDDEIAADGGSTEPFALRSFVAFRICPTDTCSKCSENFGRYVVDVETYLTYTVQNRQTAFEEMCQNCQEDCNGEEGTCSGCGSICYGYEKMEEMGYVDASQFVNCQRINVQQQNGEDENAAQDGYDNAQEEQEEIQYFVGPRCSSSQDGNSAVKIGLFSDENCYVPMDNVDIEEVLGYKLSYILLSHSLDSSNRCLSCSEDDYNNANDRQDADNVNEMCEDIYDAAAKCETPTGIQWGFMRDNQDAGKYQNQAASEFYTCNFVQSIYWNSYDSRGEINYKAVRNVYLREVTETQTIALVSLMVVIGCMLVTIRYLHYKIGSMSGLDSHGGAYF